MGRSETQPDRLEFKSDTGREPELECSTGIQNCSRAAQPSGACVPRNR